MSLKPGLSRPPYFWGMTITKVIGARTPPLSRQITVTIALVSTVALSVLGFIGYWATEQVDANSEARQTHFVSRWIGEQLEQLPKEQESVTVWDDAVTKSREGDQVWLDENVGTWMATYFGHDMAFVLRPDGSALYAMENGAPVPATAYKALAAVLDPLAAKLRSQMEVASRGQTDSTATTGDLSVSEIVNLQGDPVIASVRPIVPSSDHLSQAPGTEFLHLAVRTINPALLAKLSDEYGLDAVRLVKPGEPITHGELNVPVYDRDDRMLGDLVWTPLRPGSQMVREIGPMAGLLLTLGIGLVGWLIRRLRRSSAELLVSEAQAQFLAFHDVLTGLPNRALFEDRLERALLQARALGRKVALHSIDIDRFKNINDTLGHGAGDELIRQVAERLQKLVSETDTVSRLGGDEFSIVQADIASDADAERLAERVLRAFDPPFDLNGEVAFVTVSIGVLVSAGDSQDTAELLRKVDIALYEAKNRGRARFQTFVGDMDDLVRRRRLVESQLRVALATGQEIDVLYQPVFAADGQSILGAEALVRWNHPERGTMSPDSFIAIAEERGLIEPLGELVLRRACEVAVSSQLPWVAVNVSPLQLRNDKFADRVFEIVRTAGLAPTRLQLEITEGLLLDTSPVVENSLKRLRAEGVKIALDDFGTGYSSMSYLRKYAIDKLKIDRSFVSQLGSGPDADAIVRAMITLARSMRLQVTAEGVETTDQRLHLGALGCHEFQGFLMSKPISARGLNDRLAAQTASFKRYATVA